MQGYIRVWASQQAETLHDDDSMKVTREVMTDGVAYSGVREQS